MRVALLLLAGAVALAAGAVAASQWGDPPFPHEEHATLFPTCEGCHAGVQTGDDEALFPPEGSCAECHDGERAEEVEWSAPGPRPSNLRFFHPDHPEVVSEAEAPSTCSTCHLPDEPATRMSVEDLRAEGCVECHAHEADEHLAVDVDCSACHVSLTDAERLPVDRVSLFQEPATHDDPDFTSQHAPDTPFQEFSCSVCHARETCERCHVNADRLEEVQGLSRDERVASLEADKEAEYPLPESHEAVEWGWDHGDMALEEPARCSNCHTRPTCTECHQEAGTSAEVIGSLPLRDPAGPPGVDLEGAAETVHPDDFEDRHGSWAATESVTCQECHRNEQYCSDCHAGPESREFHPVNFMERHAFESYAGEGECQSCHSTEVFCRECHTEVGVSPQAGTDAAFHTNEPMWILTHGDAARVGLESCAACHRQTDCVQCHSEAGGWGVNPHGPGFDGDRMSAKNRATCRWCHLDAP